MASLTRTVRRLLPIVVATAAATVAASVPSEATVTPLPILAATAMAAPASAAEAAGSAYVERDGGFTVALRPATTFWLFGDSAVFGGPPSFVHRTFLSGSTAAVGATSALRELVIGKGPQAASAMPSRFMANPSLPLPGAPTKRCLSSSTPGVVHAPARWPTGLASLGGPTRLLVTFVDACETSGTVFTVESSGFAIFNAVRWTFSTQPTEVSAPQASGIEMTPTYGFPVVEANGTVDLFAPTSTVAPLSTTLRTVHLVPSATNLTKVLRLASTVATTASGSTNFPYGSLSIAHAPAGWSDPFMGVESVDHVGGIILWSAPAPAGPWREIGDATLPGCTLASLFCWNVLLHPDLSTPGTVAVSYYRPGLPSQGLGHLAMASIALPTT